MAKDPAVDASKVKDINKFIEDEVFEDPLGNRAIAIKEDPDHGDCFGFLYGIRMADDRGTFDRIVFHRGDPEIIGVNGLTNELMLAIIKHRLRFLDGQIPCEENKAAITAIESALRSLDKRFQRLTNERKAAKKDK